MAIRDYDIFSGSMDKAKWIEFVEGLAAASERMKSHAENVPGKYFVYSSADHAMVDSIDTSHPDE